MSLQDLQARAASGSPRAQYELGARLLVGREVPFEPNKGLELVAAAAAQQETAALQLSGLIAAIGIGRQQSWIDAIQLVARAAELGDERAQGQIAILGEPARFSPQAWLQLPAVNQRFASPRVLTAEAFLSPAVCAWFIARSRDRQQQATLRDPVRGFIADPARSNTSAAFSLIDSDLVCFLTRLKIAGALGVHVSQLEPLNVLKYEVGQEYRPHFDFISEREAQATQFAAELQAVGQRVATALVYLNDGFDGGETDFPRLNWRFRGKPGDALVFGNVSEAGEPELQTLHAGLPVTQGEKWLLSQWAREKSMPLASWAIR